ncbi:IS256 family transposase [Frankia sp. CiP3]|uniref:IS256 family transposase n=1 Tax=Frankia sp. CiP3 TaxID=2880971 RepID=UPI0035AE90B1
MPRVVGQVGGVQDPPEESPARAGGGGGLALPDGIGEELAAALVAEARAGGGELKLTGPGGLLTGVIKQVLERGLAAELDDHLGYGRGDAAGRGVPNSRNGSSRKTVLTEVGPVEIDLPRDRAGTFEPRLLPKGARRVGGVSDTVISLYAGGMTVRDIGHHLARTVGVEVSHDTISRITDEVLEEMKAWQVRPLDEVYPIVYVDALVAKVRDGNAVRNKAVHLAVGVDLDGVKHVLGIWVEQVEAARHWATVMAELRNRGLRDILIVCCDGLSGLPEAIGTTYGLTTVQTCTVHLIRAALRYASYTDRKTLATAMRPIYTAANLDAAEQALLTFGESDLGRKHPASVAVWERAWEQFIPFLEFTPNLRRIIYTTNAIESFNYQLRKIIKNRGHFPSNDAVVKLLWLAIVDIEDKRARAREKDHGKPASQRNAPGRLIEGHAAQGWRPALAELATAYPGRIPTLAL